MKTEFTITPEQSYTFTAKHYLPEAKPNIFCSHDSRSHHILIPKVPENENDYYPGLVKICITCNREVESVELMKNIIPDAEKAYVSPLKGLSRHEGLSPKTKETPSWARKTTVNHLNKPFIF